MTLAKIVRAGSYKFGEAAVAIVPLHRNGCDRGWMEKRASKNIFTTEIAKLAAEGGIKNHSVLHVIIVGDKEGYGYNRNGDSFSEADNKTAHTGFKDNGHVFANHKNDDPQKKTGSVVATAHNDEMRRIELLCALSHEKYAEELAGFEKGEDIPFSMGSMQDHDVCSICGHKAPTAKDHCEHIQHKLGEVLSDGRFVGMDNPDPKYFDASTVWKPADRIGYALAKVASENGTVGGHDLAESMGIRPWNSVKQATLMHLAAMEKQLVGTAKMVSCAPKDLSKSTVSALKVACVRHGIEGVLGYLHKTGSLLSFSDFTDIIVGENKLASLSDVDEKQLVNGFTRLASASDEIGDLDGDDSLSNIRLDGDAVTELHTATSMKSASVGRRVVRQAIIVPAVKTAGFGDPEKARGLADLYLHYKLAFANHPRNRDDHFTLQATVLSHPLQGHF